MENQEIFDLYDLFLEQLRDLYDGEQQQLDTLPRLDELANSFELEEIIEYHRKETIRQKDRLEKIFRMLKEEPEGESCDGIKGLITETIKLAERCKNPEVQDAAIITSLQHINHYEMAGYGTAIAYAKQLKRHDIGELLLETLREEKASDMGLSEIAENHINPDAKWSFIVEKAEREKV
ncbi:MAG: ferritin-like domain-containing protein [Candidatus Halalkalibacterium sp. M3_1C_030]